MKEFELLFKKIILFFLSTLCLFLFSSCSLIIPDIPDEEISSSKSSYYDKRELEDIYREPLEKEQGLKLNTEIVVNLPENLRGLEHPIYSKSITISLNDVPLGDVMRFINKVAGISVAFSSEELSNRRVSIEFAGTIKDFFRMIANKYDLWIKGDEKGHVVLNDSEIASLWIPTLLAFPPEGKIEAETLSVENKAESFKDRVKSIAEASGVTLVSVSEVSGWITASGTPNRLRDFAESIKKEFDAQTRYVLLKVVVLNLKLSKDHAFDFSLRYLLDLDKTLVGTIEVVPLASSEESQPGTVVLSLQSKDRLKSFVNYLRKFGKVEVLSSPILMTANGIPAEFSITKEYGYWEPGDLTSYYAEYTSEVRQGKPTWNPVKVGLSLIFRPLVVAEGQVIMDFFLKSSYVFDYAVTSWQADPELQPIQIKRPLVDEKNILNKILLKKGDYFVVAGLKTGNKALSKGILGREIHQEDEYLFVIVNAEF